MKGIYFINNHICLKNMTREQSFLLQEESMKQIIAEQKIGIIKLNPYQLHDYYTIPHALLYDLKKAKRQFDCFIYYSQQVMEDFMYTYPAKWLILQSFFKEIMVIEHRDDLSVKNIS